MLHPILAHAENTLQSTLRFSGSLDLLERPRRALLISRGERNPAPASGRICAARNAARQIIAAGEALVCGAGRNEWDVALLTSQKNGGAAIIALDGKQRVQDFKTIVPEQSLFVWPVKNASDKSGMLFNRDRLMVALADRAYAIQLRARGNMQLIADEMRARNCVVMEWNGQLSAPVPLRINSTGTAPLSSDNTTKENLLTHFTREPDGQWPGESREEYLGWLCSEKTFEPRNGFNALRRILRERRIRSCGRLISGHEPMCCFTARSPYEIVAQINYRKGLHRWTFSPYALSFQAAALESMGAQRVLYASPELIALAQTQDRAFMQVPEAGGMNWQWEREWRIKGDVDFTKLTSQALIAWVAHAEEASQLSHEFGVRTAIAV